MNAIVVRAFGEPDVLQVEDVDVPEPGDGQVVVRLLAAGVNPVDTYIRTGTYARRPSLPYVPGTDGAGIVEQIAPGVTAFAPGDRVYVAATIARRFSGAYAQYAACEVGHVHPLPARATFEQGAAIGVPYATAYRALVGRGRLRPGETVLVHGASGGVGIATVQFARAAGARVIGTAGSDRGRDLVADQGAHHVLDHTAAGYLDEVTRLTGGRGVDLVVEMLANVNLERDLGVVAQRGRVVVVGSRGTIEFTPRLTMARDASVLGMTLWNASEAEMAEAHAAIVAGLENGTLHPVVGRTFPLGEAATAHRDVLAPGAYGKLVLLP
jgi:NADPH:quinone reductase